MRALILIFIIAVTLGLYKAGKLPYFQNNPSEEQPIASSEQSDADSTPKSTPRTQQPTPALGTEQARLQAIRMYPALAQKDSPFNKAFVLLYTQAKEKNPRLLASSDWPLRLANQVGASLGVAPQPLATPTPVAVATPEIIPPAAAPAPTQWQPSGTALDYRPKKKH